LALIAVGVEGSKWWTPRLYPEFFSARRFRAYDADVLLILRTLDFERIFVESVVATSRCYRKNGTPLQPRCSLPNTPKALQNQAPHPGSIPGASTITT